jgi:hypothetical protein
MKRHEREGKVKRVPVVAAYETTITKNSFNEVSIVLGRNISGAVLGSHLVEGGRWWATLFILQVLDAL